MNDCKSLYLIIALGVIIILYLIWKNSKCVVSRELMESVNEKSIDKLTDAIDSISKNLNKQSENFNKKFSKYSNRYIPPGIKQYATQMFDQNIKILNSKISKLSKVINNPELTKTFSKKNMESLESAVTKLNTSIDNFNNNISKISTSKMDKLTLIAPQIQPSIAPTTTAPVAYANPNQPTIMHTEINKLQYSPPLAPNVTGNTQFCDDYYGSNGSYCNFSKDNQCYLIGLDGSEHGGWNKKVDSSYCTDKPECSFVYQHCKIKN